MDQCTHCTMRGNLNGCLATKCNQHESWMIGELKYVMASPATKSCTWTEDAYGNWHTGCQNIHVLVSGTPDGNGYVYCPYCGGGVQLRMTSLEICDQTV